MFSRRDKSNWRKAPPPPRVRNPRNGIREGQKLWIYVFVVRTEMRVRLDLADGNVLMNGLSSKGEEFGRIVEFDRGEGTPVAQGQVMEYRNNLPVLKIL